MTEVERKQTVLDVPRNKLEVRAKLIIGNKRPIIGPGPVRLLKLVDEYGSVQKACSVMTLSYRKAWNLLNDMEKGLGFAVLERKHGGAGGGSSRLTEAGRELIHRYDELDMRLQNDLADLFAEIFPEFMV